MLTLARIQFAMTTITHFFFVPTSIGMLLILSIIETIYFFTKKEIYRQMAKWWGKIFMSIYIVGVVIGLILEFQFGMNWSEYSKFVGDVFGVPLAIETMLAFCLEATFVGLWWFGWDRFGRGLHTITVWLVWLGSIFSALWILTANGFMQNPVAVKIDPTTGRAVMVSFFKLLQNEQFQLEFWHVFFATWVVGGFIFSTISAWKLLRKKNVDFFIRSLRIGLIFVLIGSFSAREVGNIQQNFLEDAQPMKYAVGIEGKSGAEVKQLEEKLRKEYKEKNGEDIDLKLPKILNSFFLFMAYSPAFYMGLALAGLIVVWKKWLDKIKPYLFILGCLAFIPYFTTTCGWLLTEMGRFPWLVYGMFTIKDGISANVSFQELATSISIYGFLYVSLIVLAIFLVFKGARTDPDKMEETDLVYPEIGRAHV